MTTPNLTRSRSARNARRVTTQNILDRPVALRWLNAEVLGYLLLIALSVFMHIWKLGNMAMHHDESIHAHTSWKMFVGEGGFTCGAQGTPSDVYCYNPVFHGPTLYLSTYLSYFLFGASGATARLPMALAGIALVASCWMLRPLVGKRAAFLSAIMVAISPTILYFTRFARHDALALLFTFWLIVGIFRFLHDHRIRWLHLAAAALALLWATHELVFIIIFILVTFLVQRWLWENIANRTFVIISAVVMAIAGIVMLLQPSINIGIKPANQAQNVFNFGGPAFILFATLLLGQIISLRWTTTRLLRRHFAGFSRNAFLLVLATFGVTFVILFSTFFTYPRGILDGLVDGIGYWLGSQHSYARGDQPWYYYFMQMGIYEIMPVLLMFVGLAGWLAKIGWRKTVATSSLWDEEPAEKTITLKRDVESAESNVISATDVAESSNEQILAVEATPSDAAEISSTSLDEMPVQPVAYADHLVPAVASAVAPAPAEAEKPETIPELWLGFMFYWAFMAFMIFSWAGEKMPWLTIHIALPTVLAGAWALDRILDKIDWQATRQRAGWLIVPITMGGVLMLLTASAFVGKTGADQAAQQTRISGLTIVGLLLAVGYVIWVLGSRLTRTTTIRLIALGVVAMLGIYTVRSAVRAAYVQPDVPVEFLVYTQTSPDFPIIVNEIERIAVVQNRNSRSVADPTGGHSMKILLSGGDPATGNSEGSLHQPLDWYLRDWTNLQWRDKNQIANLPTSDLDAPVAIFSKSNMAADTEQKMEQAGYIQAYTTYHNWWFPEWSSDGKSSYKEKLYDADYGCDPSLKGQRDPNGRAIYNCRAGGAAILTWPFRPSNWESLRKYMLNREFPAGVSLTGREMVVFIKRDFASLPSGDVSGVPINSSGLIKLVSEGALTGEPPAEPRGIATGPDGSLYIADAPNNRILIYTTDGQTRTITGSGENMLLEPSGVSVDAQGFVYVADTWNARVAKFDATGKFITSWGTGDEELQAGTGKRVSRTGGTAEGNAAKPLGFFGPRNVFVSSRGQVYIADTGNKRIVVTDSNGQYLGQIGTAGAAPGQFNEPIGLGMDAQNRLYVGDTWNGRIQVFQTDDAGLPQPQPVLTWLVAGWKADTYMDPFIAVDQTGRVVAAVPDQNITVLYDNTGQPKLAWGGEGTDDASLNRPSGMAFTPTGGVYIAEKGNRRVQRWELPKIR